MEKENIVYLTEKQIIAMKSIMPLVIELGERYRKRKEQAGKQKADDEQR